MAIQEVTLTSDGLGGLVSVWSDVTNMESVRFALWPLSVDEISKFLAVQARMTHRIRIRHRSGVTHKQRGVMATSGILGGIGTWTNVDINAYDETGDLTITASAASQYCTLPVASAPTTVGKRYRFSYDLANIVSTWKIQDFGGTQTIGTISANATQGTLEFTAATTGGLRIVSGGTTSSGDFDNFSLDAIRVFEFKEVRNMGERNKALEILVEETTDQ